MTAERKEGTNTTCIGATVSLALARGRPPSAVSIINENDSDGDVQSVFRPNTR